MSLSEVFAVILGILTLITIVIYVLMMIGEHIAKKKLEQKGDNTNESIS